MKDQNASFPQDLPWGSEDPEIRKTVNDKAHEDLKTRTEVFTYKIETRVPERSGLETFVITDTLESVLEFVDTEATVSVTVDGAAVTVTLHNRALRPVMASMMDATVLLSAPDAHAAATGPPFNGSPA